MHFFPALLSRQESDSIVDRIEAHFEAHGFGLWAAELQRGNSFAGFIGLNIPTFDAPFMPCVEIGWRLAAEYWRQGLATEAALAVLEYGFQRLGLNEIVAFTVAENARSRRIMEKLRMTHNSADDFDHPRLPENHPLRRHVLYRLRRSDWSRALPLTLLCPQGDTGILDWASYSAQVLTPMDSTRQSVAHLCFSWNHVLRMAKCHGSSATIICR